MKKIITLIIINVSTCVQLAFGSQPLIRDPHEINVSPTYLSKNLRKDTCHKYKKIHLKKYKSDKIVDKIISGGELLRQFLTLYQLSVNIYKIFLTYESERITLNFLKQRPTLVDYERSRKNYIKLNELGLMFNINVINEVTHGMIIPDYKYDKKLVPNMWNKVIEECFYKDDKGNILTTKHFKTPSSASPLTWYIACIMLVRDEIVELTRRENAHPRKNPFWIEWRSMIPKSIVGFEEYIARGALIDGTWCVYTTMSRNLFILYKNTKIHYMSKRYKYMQNVLYIIANLLPFSLLFSTLAYVFPK